MMVGSSLHDFRASGYSRFNAAILFQHGPAVQVYHKLHLVPFGEYVPLIDVLPWLIRLTPYRGTRLHFLDHGDRALVVRPRPLPAGGGDLLRGHRARTSSAGSSPRPPTAGSPTSWSTSPTTAGSTQTSEHEMHLAVSTFRCIENRVPLARAVNTGISAMIDGNGRIVKSLAEAEGRRPGRGRPARRPGLPLLAMGRLARPVLPGLAPSACSSSGPSPPSVGRRPVARPDSGPDGRHRPRIGNISHFRHTSILVRRPVVV